MIAVAAALGLGQPAMGTFARHPASTSFRSCDGTLGETYSHLGRLSGAFGDSADYFLGCSDGEHAAWVLVAGLVCRSDAERFCAGTDQLRYFTSFDNIRQASDAIRYRFTRYSIGENCHIDHYAGGIWTCAIWHNRQDERGMTFTTSGGEMKLDDNWSVNDKTDAHDEDFILKLGTTSE